MPTSMFFLDRFDDITPSTITVKLIYHWINYDKTNLDLTALLTGWTFTSRTTIHVINGASVNIGSPSLNFVFVSIVIPNVGAGVLTFNNDSILGLVPFTQVYTPSLGGVISIAGQTSDNRIWLFMVIFIMPFVMLLLIKLVIK